MSDNRFWLWLMLLAIGLVGCEKPQPGKQSAVDTQKRQAAQAEEKAVSETAPVVLLGKTAVRSVSRTPDMLPYRWPADFKLPLEITMDAPEPPKEIQSPSPPIEEEKPPIEEENK